MKHSKHFIQAFLLLLMMMTFAGCHTPPIAQNDLDTVNQYIADKGINKLSLEDAEKLTKYGLYQNRDTKEIRSLWQMIVDFVHNTKVQSDKQAPLGYTIVFGDKSISVEDNQCWENIGS